MSFYRTPLGQASESYPERGNRGEHFDLPSTDDCTCDGEWVDEPEPAQDAMCECDETYGEHAWCPIHGGMCCVRQDCWCTGFAPKGEDHV